MEDVTRSIGQPVELTDEQREGLAAARALVAAGVPVFRAPADPANRLGFALPPGWQHAPLDAGVVDTWRPGDALCAVMGHALDLIDIDPRSGGETSAAQLATAGILPRHYATASTPSGGRHLFVAAMHVGSRDDFMPGIDVKGGRPDGQGRGFAFLAPTVRPSKVTGLPGTYRWTFAPDPEMLAAELGALDDSGAPLAERVRVALSNVPAALIAGPADPFSTPGRRFTRDQARAHVLPDLEDFASWGDEHRGYNARLNELACRLGHFVPAFMSVGQATAALYAAALRNGSVSYQGDRAVRATIASGLGAGMREPYELADDAGFPTDEIGNPRGSVESQEKSAGAIEAAPDPSAADILMGALLDSTAMRARPRPAPLVGGLLDLDSTAWLHGRPGSYKSFVALDLAACVARGKSWHGHEVTRRPVVYLVAEGAAGMGLRTAAWEQLYGSMDGVWFLPMPIQVSDRAAWAALAEVCRRVEAGLVVLDTQARVTVGLEENSARDMGLFVDAIDMIRRATAACVLTIHHPNKNGTEARGSSAVGGAMSTILRIERTDTCRVTIHLDKQKDGDDTATVELELVRVDGGLDEITARDLSSLAVVNAGTRPPAAPRRDWIDNLTDNQAEVIGVMLDHMPALGATRAEVARVLRERRAMSGRSAMAHGSYARAWDSLAERGLIGRVRGTQTWRVVEPEDGATNADDADESD